MNLWDRMQKYLKPPLKGKTFKEALHLMIYRTDNKPGIIFHSTIITLIILSIINVMLESTPSVDDKYHGLLRGAEYLFTFLFTVEYACRIYCSPEPRKYIFSFLGIIDLLAILSIYVGQVIPGTHYLIVMRAFRLIRIFRIFKLFQFLEEGDLLLYSIRMSFPKITVFFCFVLVLVITIGTIMYLVEGSQPDSKFTSIPVSIYWAIVTLTTVGYGDITPVTLLGRFFSALVMLIGYTIIAVPTGIVTASMVKHAAQKKENDKKKCHACGRDNGDNAAFYCKYCGSAFDPSQTVVIKREDEDVL